MSNKGWHIVLWVVQGLIGIAFIVAGLTKLVKPIPELAQTMSFVPHAPELLVRFIGLSELLGGLGVILPAATRIKPILTVIAAARLALVMILAVFTHVMLGEIPQIIPPVVLGLLSTFIALGRLKKAPIAPR